MEIDCPICHATMDFDPDNTICKCGTDLYPTISKTIRRWERLNARGKSIVRRGQSSKGVGNNRSDPIHTHSYYTMPNDTYFAFQAMSIALGVSQNQLINKAVKLMLLSYQKKYGIITPKPPVKIGETLEKPKEDNSV